jgi:cytosine/adenosine deaminase-related metal-dependent hydrolase
MGIEVLSYGEWTRAKADEREAEMANAAAAAADLAAKLARSTRTTAQISAEVHANVARAAQQKQSHRPGTNFFGFGSMLGPLGKKRTRETARVGGAGMFPPSKKSRATGGSGCVVM